MDSSAEQKNTKHYPIHVTFDSNTVEYVLGVKPYDANTLGDYFDQQLSNSYAILKAAIDSGKIIPYISEGYFTSEAIEKNNVKSSWASRPKSRLMSRNHNQNRRQFK